ncbi:vWA domain-containing protein [Cellulomonas sp. URHB0016]
MEHQLSQPAVLVGTAVLVVVVGAVAAVLSRRTVRSRPGAVRVAHVARLHGLPGYRQAVRRRRAGLVVVALLTLVTLATAGWLGARPSALESRQSKLDNRDIVLCLDVSGSMAGENLAVIRTFRQLVSGLNGERIGLVVFDSMPLVLFPLTDDYDLVRDRLEATEASIAKESGAPDIAAGARDMTIGGSLVGDGLTGCAEQFRGDEELARLQGSASTAPDEPAGRSRVVILATDNQQYDERGGQLFTVQEAAQRTADLGAVLVVLDANSDRSDPYSQELAAAAQTTGGQTYAAVEGDSAVGAITSIVHALPSRTVVGPQVTSTFDVPGVALDLLLPLVVGLLVAWRVVRP